MARTDTLGNFLTDVAEAIRTKKGTTDTIQASNFDTEIASIEGASKYAPRYISFRGYTGTELTDEIANLDTSNMTKMDNMFQHCNKLTTLDISSFNVENVTSVINMFNNFGTASTVLILGEFYAPLLTSTNLMFQGVYINEVNFDGVRMPNLTDMKQMFYSSNIKTINFGNFDTSNVTSMTQLFQYCSSLEMIDISKFNTSKVTAMNSMFSNCSNLTELDLSHFDTSNVTNMNYMFQNCSVLTKLDIRNFDFSKVGVSYTSMFSGIPTDCEIIVKDDTVRTWITEKFTTLTNVKTVAELEASA